MKPTTQMHLAFDRNAIAVALPPRQQKELIEALAELLTAAAKETADAHKRNGDEPETNR
jgi:hypothetical protein